jgi:hypothetical protein
MNLNKMNNYKDEPWNSDLIAFDSLMRLSIATIYDKRSVSMVFLHFLV